MSDKLHFDYETRSERQLTGTRSVGGANYCADPSTIPILLATQLNDDEPQLWDYYDNPTIPPETLEALADPHVIKWAFNAPFERDITRHKLGIEIPRNAIRCAQVYAYGHGFTGSLAAVGAQMGLPADSQKHATEGRLISKFCGPRRPSTTNPDKFWTPTTAPDSWVRFRAYCLQDIVAERLVKEYCDEIGPLSDREWYHWELSCEINDRGLPVDPQLIAAAIATKDIEKQRLHQQLRELTGLPKVTPQPMLAYLQERLEGSPEQINNMQKSTLEHLGSELDDPLSELSRHLHGNREHLRKIITAYQSAARTSVEKWTKFETVRSTDNTVKGTIQYMAASRTGRDGGRLVQPQNLYSGFYKDRAPKIADEILEFHHAYLLAKYGDPMEVLAGTLRCAVTAPEGYLLSVMDLSSIENTVVSWWADCTLMQNEFKSGLDCYKAFATRVFNVDYASVTSEQRKFAKPPVLGCIFGLGGKGLQLQAAQRGVDMTRERATDLKNLFNSTYFEIPQMARDLSDAAMDTVRTGATHNLYRIQLSMRDTPRAGRFLTYTLPSGRVLHYQNPRLDWVIPPWEKESALQQAYPDSPELVEQLLQSPLGTLVGTQTLEQFYRERCATRETLTYLGKDDKHRGGGSNWQRLTMHGGKWIENGAQAIARDVLYHGLEMAVRSGVQDIRLRVHDELVGLVPIDGAQDYHDHLRACMTVVPPWAEGLFLDAKGALTKRYFKD